MKNAVRKYLSRLAAALTALALLTSCAGAETAEKQESTAAQTASADEAPEVRAVQTEKPADPAPESESADDDAKLCENAKPAPKLKLVPTKKKGVYKLKGLSRDEYYAEYVNDLLITFGSVNGDNELSAPDDIIDDIEIFDEEADTDDDEGEPADAETGDERETFITPDKIRVYDIDRQLLLAETDSVETGLYYGKFDCFGYFTDGFYSCDGDTARFLDRALNVTKTFKVPVKECMSFWVSADRKYALINAYKGRSVLFNIEKGQSVPLSKGVRTMWLLTTEGGSFDVLNTKGERFRIDGDGTVTPVSDPHYRQIWINRPRACYSETVSGGVLVCGTRCENAELFDYPESKVMYTLYADDQSVIFEDSSERTRLIDRRTGRISAAVSKYYSDVIGSDSGGRVLFAACDTQYDEEYYLCDHLRMIVPSELEYKKTLGHKSVDMINREWEICFKEPVPDSERSAALMKELQETYNVRVFFAPAGKDNSVDGYICLPYTGRQDKILAAIRDFLSLSPPRLLTECSANGSETWILISSGFVEDNEDGFDTAGFASDINGHRFTALETLYNDIESMEIYEDEFFPREEVTENNYDSDAEWVKRNLSHGFIHLLDNKTKQKQFKKWDKLSPKDSYTYDRCYYEYDEWADEYFIDNYARTNHLEDRARTGEYLWTSGNDPWCRVFGMYPALYKKGRLLCKQFRENFPCLASIPEGEWYMEKPLAGGFGKLHAEYEKEKEREMREQEEYGYFVSGS